MSWATRFRVRQYVRGSLWIVPLLGGVLGAVMGSVLLRTDTAFPNSWTYSPQTASTVLATIVGAMAALTGFVVTVTVLVVQMATGTFSARYMRVWYRDRMLKGVLAILVGTLALAFSLLQRVESDFVPNLGVTICGVLVIVALLLFLLFLDRFLHRLRPVAVAGLVTRAGRASFAAGPPPMPAHALPQLPPRPDVVVRARRAGAVQAFDEAALVRWASSHDCVLALCHPVGDFVPQGTALVEVYGRGAGDDAEQLAGMIALGDERTIEQDPAFALRILVDVAIRALSPAVNDPTTAVQVLNFVEEFLRIIGATDLEGRAARTDGEDEVRLLVRARRWEDFLTLSVTEIREYGATSLQVVRRMRALLETLHELVRPEHRLAVDEELARLTATVKRSFADSVDLDRAVMADRQGVGGPTDTDPSLQSRGRPDDGGSLAAARIGA